MWSAGRGVDIMLFSPGMVLTELLTDVEVIGSDLVNSLKRYPRILRMWANPPDVPAELAVRLAADGQNGKIYRVLGRRRMMAGLLAELRRMITRSDVPLPEVNIHLREQGPEG
jgi:hypothetical protein